MNQEEALEVLKANKDKWVASSYLGIAMPKYADQNWNFHAGTLRKLYSGLMRRRDNSIQFKLAKDLPVMELDRVLRHKNHNLHPQTTLYKYTGGDHVKKKRTEERQSF